jgi:hypothetical protein
MTAAANILRAFPVVVTPEAGAAAAIARENVLHGVDPAA